MTIDLKKSLEDYIKENYPTTHSKIIEEIKKGVAASENALTIANRLRKIPEAADFTPSNVEPIKNLLLWWICVG